MNQELYNELTLDKLFIYQLYKHKLVHRLTEDINDSNGRLKIIDRGLKNMRDKVCSECGVPVSLFYKMRGSSYVFAFFAFISEECNITFEEFITFENSDNEYAQNFRNILNKLRNHTLFMTGYQDRSINMRTGWRGLSLSEQMYLININLYNTYKDFIRALRDFGEYLHRQRHGENEE